MLLITVPAGVGAACPAAHMSGNMQEISSLRSRRKGMGCGLGGLFAAGRRFPEGTRAPFEKRGSFRFPRKKPIVNYGVIRTPNVTAAD
jgi:hypothetical protein